MTKYLESAMACPKCGSDDVIPNLRLVDRGGQGSTRDLQLKLDKNPDALFFKGTHAASLVARVCGNCGFVELYARSPKKLLRAYKSIPRPK